MNPIRDATFPQVVSAQRVAMPLCPGRHGNKIAVLGINPALEGRGDSSAHLHEIGQPDLSYARKRG